MTTTHPTQRLTDALRLITTFIGTRAPEAPIQARFTDDGLTLGATDPHIVAEALIPYSTPPTDLPAHPWRLTRHDALHLARSAGDRAGHTDLTLTRSKIGARFHVRPTGGKPTPGGYVPVRDGRTGVRADRVLQAALESVHQDDPVASPILSAGLLGHLQGIQKVLGPTAGVRLFPRGGRVAFVVEDWLVGVFLEAEGGVEEGEAWEMVRRVGGVVPVE